MNRIVKKLGRFLVGLILLTGAAFFFTAVMIAIDPASYKNECPAVTLEDEFGHVHEIEPKDKV